jgi:excisionase family DNA binding protein
MLIDWKRTLDAMVRSMKVSKPVKGHASKRPPKTSREDLPEAIQALLKAKEAATFLNVSENTIRMWIWQRRLPVVRLGRSVRLRRRDLEEIIERNREEAVSL